MGFENMMDKRILDHGIANEGGGLSNENGQEGEKNIEKQAVLDAIREMGLENDKVKEMISAWTEQQQALADQDLTDRSRIKLCIDQGDLWSAAGKGSYALEALRDAEDQLLPVRDQFPDLTALVLEKGLVVKKEMYELAAVAAERECVTIAKELAESGEHFSFPGISPEAYTRLKLVAEEYPEFTTPIDELVSRFEKEGMKVDPVTDIGKGNVFLIPSGTIENDNAYDDNLSPRDLVITEDMDGRMKHLIMLYKARFTKE